MNIAAESGEPSGEYAVRWIPLLVQNRWSSCWGQYGWHSTWHTLIGTVACPSKSRIFFSLKLLTPMALTNPRRTRSSIAFHVSSMDGVTTALPLLPVTGQCIRYRSRYSSLSSSRDFFSAASTLSGSWSVFQSLLVTKTSSRLSLVLSKTSWKASPTSPSFS